MRRIRSEAFALATVCFVLWLLLFNARAWPVGIRFDSATANSWAMAVAFIALPCSALAVVLHLKSALARGLAIASVAVLSLPCAGLAWLMGDKAASISRDGHDTGFLLLDQTIGPAAVYRLYRTDCGATCAYGLVLRREFEMPLGIKLVNNLWSVDHTGDRATLVTHGSAIEVLQEGSASVRIEM